MSAALAHPGDTPDFPAGHFQNASHDRVARGDPSNLNGHRTGGTLSPSAVEVSTPPPSQADLGTQHHHAGRGPILADPFLGLLAETVNDLEGVRKATANRFRQLTRSENELDEDGEGRGLGLPMDAAEVKVVHDILVLIGGERIAKDGTATHGEGGVEHQVVLNLQRQVRKHPLWKTWGIDQHGIGEKTFARLLAAVGDPYWNGLHERPRTVSELWSYCGYSVVHPTGQGRHDTQGSAAGGVAPKKIRGQKVNWSNAARMRTWNIAVACLKAQGPYAGVYYQAREKYVDATHSVDCARCGPAGSPAKTGSALSDGHKHARALRIMAKEILRDLWLASKALHEADPEPPRLAIVDTRPEAPPPAGD